MSTADESPWSEDELRELMLACVNRDGTKITGWFVQHVTTSRHEFTIVFAMASWCRVFAEKAGLIEDGDFVMMQALPGATPGGIGTGQMIAAALNGDNDALAAHVAAFMQHDDPQAQLKTVASLVQLISFLAHKAEKKLAAEGNTTS